MKYQGNISCQDGHNKGQIERTYQKQRDEKGVTNQTEEVYKTSLNDLDNHDGVVTPLEPGILECEVKWALGRITKNIASGGDGIPAEQFSKS